MTCQYCGKSLVEDDKPVKHSGVYFCNNMEYTLYQHAENYTIPPYPTEKPFIKELP